MLNVTYATAGWFFVVKKSNEAILIPRNALSADESAQLEALIATWPKRRRRRTPW